jgi:hypothetical protein
VFTGPQILTHWRDSSTHRTLGGGAGGGGGGGGGIGGCLNESSDSLRPDWVSDNIMHGY